jgi:hypothetical protein
MTEENEIHAIPKKVFIVPYRNRIQHKFFFCKYMSFILEDKEDYEIYFSHQCDARTFNRGGVKNIGFLAVKNKYPNDYKNITFIFNDVDTIPFNKIFDYETQPGIVKHYYGYKYALGGIVVIKGGDFERTNGYPCYWGWGMEDNSLQKRCDNLGIKIDRSQFYNIGSPQILQLFDGISRIISKKDPWRSTHDNGIDGLRTITNLKYTISDKSDNPNDNIYSVYNPRIFFINIKTFLTFIRFEEDNFYNYDLREPKRKIINPDKLRETRKMVPSTNDWTNIPYYPTLKEQRENHVNQLIAEGKPVPPSLIAKVQEDKMKEIKQDVYKATTEPDNNSENVEILNQNQMIHQNQIIHQHQQMIHPAQRPPPNKYSPLYAQYVGQQPRAQASARVRLGGVY